MKLDNGISKFKDFIIVPVCRLICRMHRVPVSAGKRLERLRVQMDALSDTGDGER